MTDTEVEPAFMQGITRVEDKARYIIISACSCDMDCMNGGGSCGCLEAARSIIRLAKGVE